MGRNGIFTHNEWLILDGFHVGKYTVKNVPMGIRPWDSYPQRTRRTPAWFQAAHYADLHLGTLMFLSFLWGFSWQPENQVNSPIDMDNILLSIGFLYVFIRDPYCWRQPEIH